MTYKISFDYTNYRNLDIDIEELTFAVGDNLGGTRKFRLHKWEGTPLKEAWEDIGGSFVDVEGLPTDKVPDITIWDSSNLLLTQEAFEVLREALAPFGEFLPITIDGADCQIFNCLNYVEVDQKQSENDIDASGNWLGVKRIGFTPDTVKNNLIFRTKFDRGSALYCGDEFKQLVESAKLEGLEFHSDLLNKF